MRVWTFLAPIVVFGAAACGASEGDRGVLVDIAGADKPEPAAEEEAYFSVRSDPRPCAAPVCGGYWVSRVNSTRTYCANGQWAPSCYVAELDLRALGLPVDAEAELRSEATRIVLRGTLDTARFDGAGELGTLRVSEAWRAPASGPTSGTFYILEADRAACVTFPCANIAARKLNSTAYPQRVANVDMNRAPGTASDKTDALARIGVQGLVVAGADVFAKDDGLALDVAHFFARVAAIEEHRTTCDVLGCEGD